MTHPISILPPLKVLRAGLLRTTEALAADLAAPSASTPDWSPLEWQLAAAAAAVHGVSPLLCKSSRWENAAWRSFLARQREHVVHRHGLITTLLERIDTNSRAAGVALVALKGSALHALGIYLPGERPMADIDLLVRECDADAVNTMLQEIGYVNAYTTWKHRVFKPNGGHASGELGEHRDNQILVELHTRIQEPLPVSMVDITAGIFPLAAVTGVNPYPSMAALMSHLLLHAAGNIRTRGLRLVQLNDIARLASRMLPSDWNKLCDPHPGTVPWWALPPLLLTARYYRHVIPESVLKRLASACPALLRTASRRHTLTQLSCSDLWIRALPGIEWSRSVGEVSRYIRNRLLPTPSADRERMAMARSQDWIEKDSCATLSRRRQLMVRLTRRVPRYDALHVVRAALASPH